MTNHCEIRPMLPKMRTSMQKLVIFCILIINYWSFAKSAIIQNGNLTLDVTIVDEGMTVKLTWNDTAKTVKIQGHIGMGLPIGKLITDNHQNRIASSSEDVFFAITADTENGFNIVWETIDTAAVFQDCFELLDFDWFSGQVTDTTQWRVQNKQIKTVANIVSQESPVSEPYWVNSQGGFIFVNETTPLFVDQNNILDNNLCLVAKIDGPYSKSRSRVLLNYTIGTGMDAREGHQAAIDNLLGRPTEQPDTKMIREPIWSTWAKYQNDINDNLVYDLAESVHNNEFRGQIQIDDGWEECYGSLAFKKLDFAAINKTIIDINSFALRVTLWVHPFVDITCNDIVEIGQSKGYFVKGTDGQNIVVSWKDVQCYLIDFTNAEAQSWYQDRVGLLITKHVLDGFNFDAGEASWTTSSATLSGDQYRDPNAITSDYTQISNFTHFVNVHSSWRNQWVPVFVSIPEKEPNWSQENGLKSVIINLLQLNLAGYTMVLPGLIGGKSLDRPSPELYVRWAQAVSLMPAMQFGYLPWEIVGTTFDVLSIVQKSVDLHYWYADGITNIIRKSRTMGQPVNAPIWWLDPTNPDVFKIDDQFTLGENILVAPVLTEGATSRDIYLPPGQWRDGNNDPVIYNGSTILKDYPAPIEILPYFTRET